MIYHGYTTWSSNKNNVKCDCGFIRGRQMFIFTMLINLSTVYMREHYSLCDTLPCFFLSKVSHQDDFQPEEVQFDTNDQFTGCWSGLIKNVKFHHF